MAKVKPDNIMQSWSCHLFGQAGKKDKFFEMVSDEMEERGLKYKNGLLDIGGMLGKKKEYFTVMSKNEDFSCLIGRQKIGKDLFVTWDLYSKKPIGEHQVFNFMRPFLAASRGINALFNADYNEMTQLKAFSSAVKECTVAATEKIFEKANLDKSKINRQSSGMFGPM